MPDTDIKAMLAQLTASVSALMQNQAEQGRRLDALSKLAPRDAPEQIYPSLSAEDRTDDPSPRIDDSQTPIAVDREEALIERELQKLRRSIKDLWKHKPTILTIHNFIAWKTNPLSDTSLINVHDVSSYNILIKGQQQPPSSYSRLRRAIWTAINDALHARILKSLSVEIRKIMPPQRTKNAAALWESVVTGFGITKAQERYNLLRDMCALKLEGSDYMSHQAQWLAYIAALDDLDVTVDDIKHDLFILSLRN